MNSTSTSSQLTKEWLSFCEKHEFVKCIHTPIPDGILPLNFSGTLVDVKVHGTKKYGGPDDKLYANYPELRHKVARGNCVLELHRHENEKNINILETSQDFVIFALRKFSGGMGDEDDSSEQNMWDKYFIKPIDEASRVVCTTKANGEAAHLSSRRIGGVNYFILGSKNVHLIAKDIGDVEKYEDGRYLVAKVVAESFFHHLSTVEETSINRNIVNELAEFLQRTKYTGVFELLQPNHQHIIDLTYLRSPCLTFICWSSEYSGENFESLCSESPHFAIEKAKELGFKTIEYTIIDAKQVNQEMDEIRKDIGKEGKVLYFLDSEDNVFGILKKKTAWYIILRCLREKACFLSSPKVVLKTDKSEIRKKVVKRVNEIQTWLGFSDVYKNKWIEIGVSFILWIVEISRKNLNGSIGIRSNFPILFKRYLESNEKIKNIYFNLEYS